MATELEKQLAEALNEIERLGHSTHHGRGYTLATIAEKALVEYNRQLEQEQQRVTY